MNIVDVMLQFRKSGDAKLLIASDVEIDKENLNVIVIEILAWLKLENKRSIWISEGKKTCLKPLQLDMQYPWCADLDMLVERERLFHDYFSIKEGRFDFSDLVTEDEKAIAREAAYKNYNPQKHT